VFVRFNDVHESKQWCQTDRCVPVSATAATVTALVGEAARRPPVAASFLKVEADAGAAAATTTAVSAAAIATAAATTIAASPSSSVTAGIAVGEAAGRSPVAAPFLKVEAHLAAATAGAAASAAEAAILGRAARHLSGAIVALVLIVGAGVLDLRALREAVAVGDSAEVAEEVFGAVARLDEAEAALVPPASGSLLAAASAATSAAAAAIAVAGAGAGAAIIARGAAASVAHR
jgi:hypothetical protein